MSHWGYHLWTRTLWKYFSWLFCAYSCGKCASMESIKQFLKSFRDIWLGYFSFSYKTEQTWVPLTCFIFRLCSDYTCGTMPWILPLRHFVNFSGRSEVFLREYSCSGSPHKFIGTIMNRTFWTFCFSLSILWLFLFHSSFNVTNKTLYQNLQRHLKFWRGTTKWPPGLYTYYTQL